MNDLRTLLPECPLEYQIPHISGSHTALVIEINAADIDWQEKMLPWTLAGLINNTDLIMKGVHLYVVCESEKSETSVLESRTEGNGVAHRQRNAQHPDFSADDLRDRIRTALKKFDLPPGTITSKDEDNKPLMLFGKYGYRYDSVCLLDINYWAFRGIGKAQDRADIKLPLGHVLRHTYNWAVADYSLHIANEIDLKDSWVQMSEPLPAYHFQKDKEKIREYLADASTRAKWLHDANTAVYGEDYEKQNKNVAAYFFNEVEPNWHLDASILHYSAREVNTYFAEWAAEWQHLGTEALVALYLLKTEQHAHNIGDSVMIESSYTRAAYPRLCNMGFADVDQFRTATKELMGAQLALSMN